MKESPRFLQWLITPGSRVEGLLRPVIASADQDARRFATLTLAMVAASSLAAALAPVALKHVIDGIDSYDAQTVFGTLAPLMALYVLAQWAVRVFRELQAMFLGRTDQRLTALLSQYFFQHVISLPIAYHLDRQTGGVAQILSHGLLGYRMILQHLIGTLVPLACELFLVGLILVFLDHAIFLLIIGTSMLAFGLAFRSGAASIHQTARGAATAHTEVGAMFTDTLLNMETVKYFQAEGQVVDRFVEELRTTERRWNRLFSRRMENGILVASIFAISLGLSLLVATRSVLRSSMTVGEFVLVNSYVLQLMRPIESLGLAIRDLAQGRAFAEKMTKMLRNSAECDKAGSRTPASGQSYDLVLDQVSLSYDAQRFALRDCSLTIPMGTTVGIVGHTGSGKSSVIRLLVRFMDPTSGRITIGGTPIADVPLKALRNWIAVVPQDVMLLNDSIACNIALGRPFSSTHDIERAAAVAGIHEFISSLPKGYETRVGERGLTLSGGERQRIAIARAAIREPRIVILDEPTSSLDAWTEQAILERLMSLAGKTTTIIVTHRLAAVANAQEIVVLDHGMIVERGTHSALLAAQGVYAAMWTIQRGDRCPPCDRDARQSVHCRL